MTDTDTTGAEPPGLQQHQAGSMQPSRTEEQANASRADRLLRLTEQLVRAGGTIDTGLRDMLAEVTAMEAAYLFADQMSYSTTVLPEYQRNHQPSTGRGPNKSYGPPLGRQAAINGAAAIMYGRALGIGMTQSLQVIHNIRGKSGLDARTMQALCETHGDVRFTFDPDNDGEAATVGAERPGHKPVSSTWTMAHAEQRDYTTNPLYKSHPDEMLRAKALAECCRLIAPDVILGLAFTYEELQLDANTTVEVVREREPGARGMAGLSDRLADAKARVVNGDGRIVDSEVMTPERQAEEAMHGQVDDEGIRQQERGPQAGDDAWAERMADEAQAEAPEPEGPDAKGLTALHTALGEAGFAHRSQKLGIVGAMVGRPLESTNELSNEELGKVNNLLRKWNKDGVLADRCRSLLATGDAIPDDPQPDPPSENEGSKRATTKELQGLRKAYREHLKISGEDMLPHLSQTLGWDVDDVNKLSQDDVFEAIRVVEGKVQRG